MKINIIYILGLLFIFSCDTLDDIVSELDENEVQLDFDYYIQEGWDSFESEDFLASINFFDYILNAYQSATEEVQQDIVFEAYHGYAWSNFFIASTLFGEQNSDQRLEYRNTSYNTFFIADAILDTISFNSDNYSFAYDCDILAGKVLHHDYKIYYYLNQYFAYDGDLEYLEDVDIYSNGEEFIDLNGNGQYDEGEEFIDSNNNNKFEFGLQSLITQMNVECSDYDFPYAEIDINKINMMLVKDYLRKGMYSEAASFIETLNLSTINLEFNVEIPDQDISNEMYLIGDFLNKTVDSNDLYNINLDTKSVSIEVTPFLPCNFYDLDMNALLVGEDLRDELLDCVDTYFETSSEITFRYKFVNGSFDESIYNQETNLSSQCSDIDGYRTLDINLNTIEDSIVINSCYNSCSQSCFNN